MYVTIVLQIFFVCVSATRWLVILARMRGNGFRTLKNETFLEFLTVKTFFKDRCTRSLALGR